MLNAISIDVEEYFQVSAFEPYITEQDWTRWPSCVERETDCLLELFDSHGTHATFFTLGWVADRFPGLVRKVVAAGHELGCHGYKHRRLTEQTPETLKAELSDTKALLEDLAGAEVSGFRAASFSITASNQWAFNVIEEAGFRYSSSVYPVRRDLYGNPDAPRVPYCPNDGALLEIPVSTVRVMGRNYPAGGGGFFRLFPYQLSRALIRRLNQTERLPANMYFHPWEFDPGQPRLRHLSPKTRFRHYVNQHKALNRLSRLLQDFRWGPFCEVYAGHLMPSRNG